MKLSKLIVTDEKFVCENCRSNAIEINLTSMGVYEVVGCPLCHSDVYGVRDGDHFWKVGEKVNQLLEEMNEANLEHTSNEHM